MKYETAGDPMTGLRWTRKTPGKIAVELNSIGILVSEKTVAMLLKQMNYSLRVNHKKVALGGKPYDVEKRDGQFAYIKRLREKNMKTRLPIISVDAKKRELIGNFKNAGATWTRNPIPVNDHDFRSDATGIGISYGIYNTELNKGAIFVGTYHDTPLFAAESIERWWRREGVKDYPKEYSLHILADSGGSNSYRSRLWKFALQEKLADQHNLSVTVSHYPPGASKWNPIDHRLFSEISKNWAGRPLDSYETMLKYIRTTKTKTGLTVKAYLIRKKYETGIKVSDEEMESLFIERHKTCPEWNYTLHPRKM